MIKNYIPAPKCPVNPAIIYTEKKTNIIATGYEIKSYLKANKINTAIVPQTASKFLNDGLGTFGLFLLLTLE